MELQGNKATHDFLSLYTKDSSFPHQDPRPSSQGFFLKTHDFLQPLERGEEKGEKPPTRDVAGKGPPTEHVLPGGIGTFSICRVADVGGGARTEVKPELVTVGKPEPDSGGFARYPTGAPFGIWGESASRESASRGGGHWSLPYGGRGSGATASSASRHNQATERKGYMDAVSMSSRGFDEDENDGEDFTRREASSSLKELTVRTDGKGSGSGSDQRPNTPRSKHSATEQRRRSKINDRFQILRELIPHSDQKRDKASFLLEVIEYIRFLQEKVQKFESSYPPDYQDNPKLMPWANAYFRSFWKNAENKNFNGEGMPDPALFLKNGGVGFPFPTTPIVANPTEPVFTPTSEPVSLSGPSPSPIQTETQAQVQWLRQTLAEDSALSNTNINTNTNIINTAATNNVIINNNNNNNNNNSSSDSLVNEREDLAIDEGTISLSTNYSQELLTVLSQALQRSGIDLSEASISVQISLGKRAKKSCTAAGGTSLQEGENENNDRGKGCEENVRPVKRRKADKNNNS